MTAICTAQRNTSQGLAPCHQPEAHHGDHIAVLADSDGGLWAASWGRDQHHIDLATLTPRKAAA